MSVDSVPFGTTLGESTSGDPTPGAADPISATPATLLSLFAPRTRLQTEPGVWTLMLIPVLVCVAMLIFVSVSG